MLRAGLAATLGGALALGLVAPATAAPVATSVSTVKTVKVSSTKIATQPRSAAAVAGKKATFTVKAKGSKLSYRWYVRKPGKSSFAKISGATKATYKVVASTKLDGAKYRVVVKGGTG
ncbi:hypothetical protein D1825_12725, partial [Cellulomonas rhizosphaerae]